MSDRPNILFILSDQQRWDTLGCYGQRLNISPNLDRMADEGVRFEHAFTMNPLCGPARASFQTGRHGTQTGCFTNGIELPTDTPTIAKQLNDIGYETAYIGKWHLASDRDGENFRTRPVPPQRRGGYQHWLASDVLESTSSGYTGYMFDNDGNRVDWEGYRVDKTTDFALDYLRDYATRTHTPERSESASAAPDAAPPPFFIFLSYIEPHHQNNLNRYIGPIGSKERFKHYDTPGDLAAFDSPGSPAPDWRQHYPDYLGCCWSIDQNVGRLRDALAMYGLDENTLIIYTSDHGSHFRTRNSEYKRSCHESSIRVPLTIRGPGFRGGQVIDQMVSLIDTPRTVLEAAQAEPLPEQAGRALQPLAAGQVAAGEADDWPEEAFVQISAAELGRALRTHRWKYGVTAPHKDPSYDPDSDRYVETYLYDLENDPHELDNRVADPALADVRRDLAARLKRRMAEAGEAAPVIDAATGASVS